MGDGGCAVARRLLLRWIRRGYAMRVRVVFRGASWALLVAALVPAAAQAQWRYCVAPSDARHAVYLSAPHRTNLPMDELEASYRALLIGRRLSYNSVQSAASGAAVERSGTRRPAGTKPLRKVPSRSTARSTVSPTFRERPCPRPQPLPTVPEPKNSPGRTVSSVETCARMSSKLWCIFP